MNERTKLRRCAAMRWIGGVAAAAALAGAAIAGEHSRPPAALNADFQRECGSCHIAYSPRLLSATAWRTMMQGLDRHFGVDASIDAPTAETIGAYLEANAAADGGKRSDPTAMRITQARWFRHEHGRIGAAVWQRADVGSPANCGACHLAADRGDFSERNLRLPR